MATITGPRPTRSPHVSELLAVNPALLSNQLKRSPRRQAEVTSSEASRSLRDIYLAPSEKVLKALNEGNQPTVSQDHGRAAVLETFLTPSSGYKPLPSYPPSPPPANTSSVVNTPVSSKRITSNETQSCVIQSPSVSLKAAREKPLPPKPAERSQDSPERRGVFDAQDLTANLLNSRYPPLKPAKSQETIRSDWLSAPPRVFQVGASLLSRNQSPGSFSTGELGVSSATTVQLVNNPHVGVDTERANGRTPRNYNPNGLGSSKIPRNGSLLQNGQLRYGSPTRSPNSASKANRSILRGRHALSVRSRRLLFSADTQLNGQGVTGQEGSRSDPLFPESTPTFLSKIISVNNGFEKNRVDEGIQRTSSKYGYNIRESLDAREAIMGQPEPSQPKNSVDGFLSSLSNSPAARWSRPVHELKLEFGTPTNRSNTVKHSEPGISGGASGFSRPRGAIKSAARATTHPHRTSSLMKPPYPLAHDPAPNSYSPPVIHTERGGVKHSETGEEDPRASPLSLFYRQTASSTARAAFNAKKSSQPRAFTPQISQSRTLSSLGDVGKGVKNLGKRVGKIIPHRRSVAVETMPDGFFPDPSEGYHGSCHKASHMLTTYNNSGLEDSPDEISHLFANSGDGLIQPEANDHKEGDETEKGNEHWRQASRNFAYHDETGHYISYGWRRLVNRGNGGDEERPPPPRRGRVDAEGHYVEDDAEVGAEELADTQEDENARDTQPAGIQRANIEGNVTVVGVETNTGPAIVDVLAVPTDLLISDDQLNERLATVGPTGVDHDIPIGNQISDIQLNEMPADAGPAAVENVGPAQAQTQTVAPDILFDQLIADTDARTRELLSYATALVDSPFRTLMLEGATHLTEGLLHTRQARINLIRSNQSLDEAIVLLAATTHQLGLVLHRISNGRPM